MLGLYGHAHSIHPDEIVAAAIANYYLDLQMFPNYACDITRRLDGIMVPFQESQEAIEMYWFNYLPQADGSWSLAVAGAPLDPKIAPEIVLGGALDKLYSGPLPRFSFRDIPRLFRPQTVRQEELDNRVVWVVEFKIRPHAKWPAELPRFHMVQMWIDQQSGRMLRLAYIGARHRVQYTFRTPSPGFVTEFHVESVNGSFQNRKRSTYDEFLSYQKFDVSTVISLP